MEDGEKDNHKKIWTKRSNIEARQKGTKWGGRKEWDRMGKG